MIFSSNQSVISFSSLLKNILLSSKFGTRINNAIPVSLFHSFIYFDMLNASATNLKDIFFVRTPETSLIDADKLLTLLVY